MATPKRLSTAAKDVTGEMASRTAAARAAAEQQSRAALRSPWFARLARLGYATKGTVYLLIGILALQAALGRGGRTTDSHGVLETIVDRPFGSLLLGLAILGLAGYALWRLVQAIFDADRVGGDTRGMLKRTSYAASGIVYGLLALTAIQLLRGARDAQRDAAHDWTARLLGAPFGRGLVFVVALGVIGLAAAQFYRAYTTPFRETLDLDRLAAPTAHLVVGCARFGLAARGVVFGIVAMLILQADLQSNPDRARGVGGALDTLARQPHGPLLLAVIAIGLVAYALYQLAQAGYRRIRTV